MNYSDADILAWAKQRSTAKPPPPPIDLALLNAAIDRLISSGKEFTVLDLPVETPWREANQRLSKLRTRREVVLVKESPVRGDQKHPRVWVRGPISRTSFAEAGRRGAEVRNRKTKL